jgi:Ni2+-binding GTPase involved in maturation of urease and hydrogenase
MSAFESNKKYYIITAGPTGSGKTNLIDNTIKHLNINNNGYKKFLVDDLVENDQKYKDKISTIIKEIETECKQNDITDKICEKEKYINPDENLIKKFNDAYFEVRKKTGCDIEFVDGREYNGCDQKLINELKQDNKPDIIVIETVGTYIPTWLFENEKDIPEFIPDDYSIIISYSLVNINNLIERNKNRTYNNILNFKKNPDLPAPRLPSTNYRESIDQIIITLQNLYNSCINKNKLDTNICGKRKIDKLLIFDNNGSQQKLVFDSTDTKMTTETFNNLIESLLLSPSENKHGGSKKQKSKKSGSKKQKSKKSGSKKQKLKNKRTKKYNKIKI